MKDESYKAPVFLIDLSNEEDYSLFLEALNTDASEKSLGGHSFMIGQTTAKEHRYLGITLFESKMFWGGDSELRPLGRFTSEYAPIGGRAITFAHYLEILAAIRKEDNAPAPQSYRVEMDDSVREILKKDRYEGWHRPYFAMQGHTHRIYNICPLKQTYLDAAPTTAESIPATAFVAMYKATYEICEPMDFCDYREYLVNAERDGSISEPALSDTVEGLYNSAVEDKPVGIIKITDNTPRILPKTFKSCTGLTDVIFPEGLEAIGPYAFCDCGGIRRIYLPKSIKQIHFGAFHNCFSLVEVYYAGSKQEWAALRKNNISGKAKEPGIARFKNNELLRVPVHCDCSMGV